MILNLLVLLISATVWVAALWLLIVPDFTKWANPAMFALHAAPPLAVWILWLGARRWTKRRKADEARHREEKAQAERTAAREAAQKKHEEEVRQRCFACDCRMVAIAGLGPSSALTVQPDLPNVDIRPGEPAGEAGVPALDRLTPAIRQALTSIYEASGASAAFPIYVIPPADAVGEEVLACVRAIHTELVETLALGIKPDGCSAAILFLPSGDCATNNVLALFETIPDLPGAVVLAFDSPFARAIPNAGLDDDDFDPARKAREQLVGPPREGVIALLLTNAELPAMLAAIAGMDTGQRDSMTPFWQKGIQPGGHLSLLMRADAGSREQLAQLPVLGRVHRAVLREIERPRSGVLEMTRQMQTALEHAQINAALIALPFVFDGVAAEAPAEESAAQENSRCGRLVHNAGGVEVGGKRLAALGSALYYFGIDLNPVDTATATNLVTQVGDLGRATGICQLALSAAHAAQQLVPVLCAEFSERDGVAVSFVMPVATAV